MTAQPLAQTFSEGEPSATSLGNWFQLLLLLLMFRQTVPSSAFWSNSSQLGNMHRRSRQKVDLLLISE